MANIAPNLPVPGADGNLALYFQEIRKFPVLEAGEEYMLAKSWREHGNLESAHRLVTSHLRLVAKIAMGYRGYGLPLSDLIAEGNVGMMQAVKRFDPEKGFRLSTYAMWWIRASIQEYVLHSWSLVKIGTTAAQKRLFFNLRKLKREMRAIDGGALSPEQVAAIAKRLDVSENEVVSMEQRMSGPDSSLNAPVAADGESEWQDWLVDDRDDQETRLGEAEELARRKRMLVSAMTRLNPRERAIITARRMQQPPATLEELSQRHKVSRERVRQIEVRAFAKLQDHVRALALPEDRMLASDNGSP
ncbi:MAG: RNA polymerase sigma factor RpoH [Alphaproteobacteria bacterium]